MELGLGQKLEQRQVLSLSMRQSLAVLQLPLPELRDYLEEQLLSNPLLEMEGVNWEPLPTAEQEIVGSHSEQEAGWEAETVTSPEEAVWRSRYDDVWEQSQTDQTGDLSAFADQGESYTDLLCQQLGEMASLPELTRKLSLYLVECLNTSGYLAFDLSELAQEKHVPLFEMEQALWVVQSLQPAGTGARSLTECLILQLAQSGDFSAHTIRLVQDDGLSLLAKNDLLGIARLLGCTKQQAQIAAEAVRRLNPIPSRGYAAGAATQYQVPEAIFHRQGGQLVIEANQTLIPRLQLNEQTAEILRQSPDASDKAYLKRQTANAKQLITCLENRQNTLALLLDEIVRRQKDFFLSGAPLVPMTMAQLAEALQVNISTISRAVQGKSIQFEGKNLWLKDLFTTGVPAAGGSVSNEGVHRQIARFISAEDPRAPLSDEDLRAALAATGVKISRRTVAKYREELGIASSSVRRKKL